MTAATGPPGLRNFRDLGGLPARGGRRTRHGLIFRSESLQGITPEDVAVLRDTLGICNVIDLRATLELSTAKPEWIDASVAYTNLPFSDGFDEIDPNLDEAFLRNLVARKYDSYLVHARSNIVSALENVASAAEQQRPTVVNCTYGKDRTGVLAALLLELLEVERQAVVDDYAASEASMAELLVRMKGDPVHGPRIAHTPKEVYMAEEHSIRTFLENLDAAGGASVWARENGLSEDAVERLRSGLLV